MSKELLSDELWEEIAPLLPPPPPRTSKGGRPTVDNRAALLGILFVNRSGIPWQMLPAEVFGVSGSSCWRRLRDWTRAGIWPKLQQRLLNRLGKAFGVDLGHVAVDSQSVRAVNGGEHTGPNPTDRAKAGCKRHVLTNAQGIPLVVQTTAANVNDEQQLPKLLEAMPAVQGPRGRPRRKPGSIFSDRAYGTAAMIALVTSMAFSAFWPLVTTAPTAAVWARSDTWWSGRWPGSASSGVCACVMKESGNTFRPFTSWPPVVSLPID